MEKTTGPKAVPTPRKIYQLDAISPIDGRYRRHVEKLAEIFSERGLMRHRLMVEGEYLISLHDKRLVERVLSHSEKRFIRSLYRINPEWAQIIKEIEVRGFGDIPATNHDVKAIEYFMQVMFKGTSLEDTIPMIHFGLTSEDTNNLAYALMLKKGINEVIIPALNEIRGGLATLVTENKDLPIPGRTHGQVAIPTTFGKEFAVFYSRLSMELEGLNSSKLLAKLNGAMGNYSAHQIAMPNVNWPAFANSFIIGLDFDSGAVEKGIRLEMNPTTTQIEPHDTYARLFDTIRRANTILIGFNQDLWRYISDDWIKQKPVAGEVGSSTMPQKVNPIHFEQSEGKLGEANALYEFFSRKLPISRLQRDLSDSTVERDFGTALASTLIGYNALTTGLPESLSIEKGT